MKLREPSAGFLKVLFVLAVASLLLILINLIFLDTTLPTTTPIEKMYQKKLLKSKQRTLNVRIRKKNAVGRKNKIIDRLNDELNENTLQCIKDKDVISGRAAYWKSLYLQGCIDWEANMAALRALHKEQMERISIEMSDFVRHLALYHFIYIHPAWMRK